MAIEPKKLATPGMPRHLLDRPALLARLRRGVDGPLTVIVGSAGWGKSVLVGQWRASTDQPTAWLAADAADEDAVRFGAHVAAALARVWPGFDEGAVRERLDTGGAELGPSFLDALVEEAGRRRHTALVIDDAHLLPAPILAELGELATSLPPTFHLVVVSRAEPAMGLHRLRLAGALTVIDQDDLAFDLEETRALVADVSGHKLDDVQTATLQARTEGWPAGVQLVALALGEREDVDAYLAGLSGDDRHIADYLTEEVIDRLPADVRTFLERTSVLRRLSAPLCDALLGTDNSQRLLEELERHRLFLLPLDDHRGWYRYHHLFAGLLRYQLRASDPSAERPMLERAAAWHLARGELAEGAEYLLDAEAWRTVMDLAIDNGWRLYEQGKGTMAIRWLSRVPEAVRRADPQATIALVVLHQTVGNAFKVDALLDEVERDPASSTDTLIAADVIRAGGIQWHQPPARALAHAERAAAWLQARVGQTGAPWLLPNTPDTFVSTYTWLSGGRALADLGRPDDARAWFTEAHAGAGTYPPWHIHLLGAQARLEADCGALERARALGRQALAMADEAGFRDHVSTADAHLALAQVAIDRYELEAAATSLLDAYERARRNRRTSLVAAIVVQRARWHLATGDLDEGLALLAAHRHSSGPPLGESLVTALTAVHGRLLLAAGSLAEAEAVVGRAPQRSSATSVVTAQAALARGDRIGMEQVLHDWPGPPTERTELERLVATATSGRVCDDPERADAALRAALRLAAPDGHVAVWAEAGEAAARVVHNRAVTGDGPYVQALATALPAPGTADIDGHRSLSPREQAVLSYLATRLDNAEIASRLFISPNTLKTHLRRIYRKLDVQTREDAVRRGEDLGLI